MTPKANAARVASTGGGAEKMGAGAASSRVHYNTRQAASQVYAAGRVVGTVKGDTFGKQVRSSKHFLRKPPAIALDCESLAQARSLGARYVEIHDADTSQVYTAALDLIERAGFVLDRGFGRQIALPLARWSVSRPGDLRQMELAL